MTQLMRSLIGTRSHTYRRALAPKTPQHETERDIFTNTSFVNCSGLQLVSNFTKIHPIDSVDDANCASFDIHWVSGAVKKFTLL